MSERRTFDHEAVRDLAGLYALGALDLAEAEAVREHLASCGLEHPELADGAAVAGAMLETVAPVEPPPALKSRLLAAAEADLREGRHPSTAAATLAAPGPVADRRPVPAPEPLPEPVVPHIPFTPGPSPVPVVVLDAERSRRRFRWASLAAVAALALAVGLGAWNLQLRNQLQDAAAYQQGVEAALQLAAAPGSSTAVLASQDGSVSGLGVVGADGTVLLAFRGLTPTTGSQVYAAWSIGEDDVPVNIGELTASSDGSAAGRAAGAAAGDVIALTLEPAAGATTPTMPIIASGTAEPVSG